MTDLFKDEYKIDEISQRVLILLAEHGRMGTGDLAAELDEDNTIITHRTTTFLEPAGLTRSGQRDAGAPKPEYVHQLTPEGEKWIKRHRDEMVGPAGLSEIGEIVDDLRETVDNLENRVSKIEGEDGRFEGLIQQLEDRLDDLDAIDTLEEEVREERETSEQLREEAEQAAERANKQAKQAVERLERAREIQDVTEGIESQVATNKSELERLEGYIDSEIQNVRNQVDDNDGGINMLDKKYDRLKSELDNHKSKFEELEERVTKLEEDGLLDKLSPS